MAAWSLPTKVEPLGGKHNSGLAVACKVRDIQEAAGVDEADHYKWMRGKTPDHYSTCVAIERVLHDGLPRRPEKGTHMG